MSGAEKYITLTKHNFQREVLNSPIPVLVDFWAPWCGPCWVMNPIMTELADAWEGEIKVAKLNIDDCPELATQYQVEAIPCLLFFQDGEVDQRWVGVLSKADLIEKVQAAIRAIAEKIA